MPHPLAKPLPSTPEDAVRLAASLRERTPIEPGSEPKAVADALLEQMRRDRLVWAMAPAERGGFGLTLRDSARVTFQLAKASGSLGLIYAMHGSQALTLLRHSGDSPFLQALTDQLIADQALVASGTSEKGVGGDIFGSACAVESKADGELQVVKDSPNISYVDHAHAVLVTAMRDGPNDRRTQVLIAAETTRMALRPGRDTRLTGMRGILNGPYGLTARFGPEAIFAEPYPAIAGRTMTPSIHVLWAAMWSGLAATALGKAKAYLAKQPAQGEGAELMQVELSRLVNRHYVMNALVREAAADFDGAGAGKGPALDLAGTARVKRLKVVCSELLEEICLGALGVIGLPAYAEDGPFSLSEVLRDALSARVMISNNRLLLANAAIERYTDEAL
jgi:acyl-CoA dehydrogenase